MITDNCYLPNTLQSCSKLFQCGVVKVYILQVVCRGFLGDAPSKILLNWTLGDHLRPFLDLKSHVLQMSANRISTVACEVVIADCV